ncbi:hypothetical protein CROQUDRAFT_671172 [Cronartium quercuum f. sp. fusiforme G11]|uniref:Uncharacterized protein n=1 Tax=Cronartium quercuum f. sp. fusiforme G11 TaxID=708437 RepID=A0A9P6NGC9_9BASI|nr:hypothetical protein CROQUDRAFT_671172 [Cronartium quercuum f. sp. fusiforme G11]
MSLSTDLSPSLASPSPTLAPASPSSPSPTNPSPTSSSIATTTPTPTPAPTNTITTLPTSRPITITSSTSPVSVPITSSSGTPPAASTVIRTITQGSGTSASVVVVTQTALGPAPTDTTTSTGTSSSSGSSSDSGSSSSGKTIAIAIPSAIGGLALIIIIIFGIRALMRRAAASRAAEDIRWPETVTSDGDRAALYPEPTRPSAGHGLGLGDEEPEHEMVVNMAGAGVGGSRHGLSNTTTRSHSDTTSGLGSANLYAPFEYAPSAEFAYPQGGPPHLPLPGSLTAAGYGMGVAPGSLMGPPPMNTYPPEPRDGQRTNYGQPPEMMTRATGTRESYGQEGYGGIEISPDSDEPYHTQRQSLIVDNQPVSTHDLAQGADGPRDIQYAAYPHGGYGRETDAGAQGSNENMMSPVEGNGSPEWKLAVNNPDTH